MRGTTVRLAVAFVAAIAAFVGSTLVALRAERGIDEDALAISEDAAPGVEAISAIRAEVRAVEALVVRHVVGAPVSEHELAAARERLERKLEQALVLPGTREEAQLLGALQRSLRDFDEAAERALEQSRAGRTAAARDTERELSRFAAESIDWTSSLIDLAARDARDAAGRIERQHRHATRLAWELDALAAALVLFAAFYAVRAVRQFQRIQDQTRRMVERKAEELEQFAGRVAHDVLGPLSTVGMSFAVAARQAPPAVRETLGRGEASLQRVRRIVDGLLDFARAGARPDPTARADVGPAVAGLEEELLPIAAQQDAELQVEPFRPCAVACSPGVLLSILSNLLRNAFKYLGDAKVRRVVLRVRARRSFVVFEVEDTGPGIPEGLRGRLFEAYVRGNHPGTPGTGLGLATVKKLVEAHGGSISVGKSAGGGALFRVELHAASVGEAPHPVGLAGETGERTEAPATPGAVLDPTHRAL